MSVSSADRAFWWRWTVANSLAELVGLGGVAACAAVLAARGGGITGAAQALAVAALFVALGAFEGAVVGWAQARVLCQRLPRLDGWVRATVVGAMVSWALGMAPSTAMHLAGPGAGAGAGGTAELAAPAAHPAASAPIDPTPPIGAPLQALLAAGLGLVTGPALAFFQWRRLRQVLARRAQWWLPANALAWALGMPVVFAGADLVGPGAAPWSIALAVAATLLVAGALVGAVHGRALLWMMSDEMGAT